jgi:hypothetical protein
MPVSRREQHHCKRYGKSARAAAAGRRVAAVSAVLALFTAWPLSARNPDWAAFAAASSPKDDTLVVELLLSLPLNEALEVADALASRPDPALSRLVMELAPRETPEPERASLVLRVMLEALLALPEAARREALVANAETAAFLLGAGGQAEAPMLRAAVWRLAGALPEDRRQALLPVARGAASDLYERVRTTRMGPELAAEGRAFLSYLAGTPDATLTALADAMREESRNADFVRRAREVLAGGG